MNDTTGKGTPTRWRQYVSRVPGTAAIGAGGTILVLALLGFATNTSSTDTTATGQPNTTPAGQTEGAPTSQWFTGSAHPGNTLAAGNMRRASTSQQNTGSQHPEDRGPKGLHEETPDTATATLKLREARALLDSDQAAEARDLFEDAAVLYPHISDWVRVFIAETYAAEGNTEAARKALDGDESVREIGLEWGWRIPITAELEAGDSANAAKEAEAAANRLESAVRKSAAATLAGEIRLELAERTTDPHQREAEVAAARRAFWNAIDAAPSSTFALTAARELEGLAPDPEERLELGRVLITHGVLSAGLEHLDAYLESGTASASEEKAVALEAARAAFNARNTGEAGRRLRALLEDLSGKQAAEISLLLGRNYLRAGQLDRGRRMLRETADRYPETDAGLEARFLAADYDHDDGKLDSALADYRIVAKKLAAPNGAVAAGRAIAIALVTDRPDLAVEIARSHAAGRNDGTERWQAEFWLALSSSAAGNDTEAEEIIRSLADTDRLGYYGITAARILGQPALLPPLGAAPTTPPAAARRVDRETARWDVLRAAEERTAAAFELSRIRERYHNDEAGLFQLAEAMKERGEGFTVISIGRQLERRSPALNERLLKLLYPFPFQEIILAEAARAGVDPFLAAGLIRQESMFNTRAVSPAGAIGLMQVMPATGRAVARSEGLAHNDQKLHDVEHNVRIGMTYLRDMLNRFDGHLVHTLAAYNAGPRRLESWLAFPESREELLFVERIPFRETRNYVRIVQTNAEIYRMLYGPG